MTMGRPRKSENEKRSKRYMFRFSDDEYKRAKSLASGIPLARYMRERIFSARKTVTVGK